MRGVKLLAATGLACVLAACGGGGGGVAPTPAPPTGGSPSPSPAPTPSPTSANSSFAERLVSQAFASDGAASNAAFNTTSNNTITGTPASGGFSVSYNSQSDSYTVSSAGQSQTFAAADITSADSEEVRYRKVDGTNRDNLTLELVPLTGMTATQYVRLGFWQRNVVAEGRQDTLFSAFTYGFNTPAASVPRTGVVSFDMDVFGFSAFPGFEPKSFQGRGQFDVDLAAGVFSANSLLTETALVTGSGASGGTLELTAAGRLSSSDGSFSGNIIYGSLNGRIGGSVAGRFYGPAANELGAAFSGSKSDGAIVTGAFTGQRDPTNSAANLTLTNLTKTQRFFGQGVNLQFITNLSGSSFSINNRDLNSSIEDRTSGNIQFGSGSSELPGGDFTTTSIVPSANPNFTAYSKTIDGQLVSLDLYKPGSGNSELALTYVSFARYQTMVPSFRADSRHFLVYGLSTPTGLLSGRTGSGTYSGVVYGSAGNVGPQAKYDLNGTSRFDVNFSNQSYTGNLVLRGNATNGAVSLDFGTFDFGGQLPPQSGLASTGVRLGSATVGNMTFGFYGPDGEEIGGKFLLTIPTGTVTGGTNIAGITVAKRQ